MDEILRTLSREVESVRSIQRETAMLQFGDPLELSEYIKGVLLVELIRYSVAGRRISRHRDGLKVIFDSVGLLDALYSISNAREALSLCTPLFRESVSPCLWIRQARHPLLSDAVCNDVKLGSLQGGSLLISGSNMSGKTTYLRTVAINVVLSQTVLSCFASHYEATPLKVLSCINLADDLLSGRSFFRVELERIQNIIDSACSGNALVVLDEIFRGTNPLERCAATVAVLEYLEKKNVVLATIHDLSIADLILGDFREAHFCETQRGGAELDFDFRLREGRLANPNAISLLDRIGYPRAIVARAMSLLE